MTHIFVKELLLMEADRSISQLLSAWGDGDPTALDQLTPKVYQELHKLARAYLRRGQPNLTLQPTALINEAYIRLLDQSQPTPWKSRAHFFGIAALISCESSWSTAPVRIMRPSEEAEPDWSR